jgi:hypothetical protein
MSDNSALDRKLRANDPINREYGLMVKVDVRMIQVPDVNLKGEKVTYNSRMIFLVPQVSSSASAFFDAWLPDVAYKKDGTIMHHELAVKFSHPLFRVVRCGICRKNSNYPDAHHMILMNAESAEDILASLHGTVLQVYVLPDTTAETSIEN